MNKAVVKKAAAKISKQVAKKIGDEFRKKVKSHSPAEIRDPSDKPKKTVGYEQAAKEQKQKLEFVNKDASVSAAVSVFFDEIPSRYITEGSDLDMSKVAMHLIGGRLMGLTGDGLRGADDWAHYRKSTVKVAAGDADAKLRVYLDGIKHANEMQKVSTAVQRLFDARAKAAGMEPDLFVLKLACDVLGKQDGEKGRSLGVVKCAGMKTPVNKKAAWSMMVTGDEDNVDLHRVVKSAFPSIRKMQQKAAVAFQQKHAEDDMPTTSPDSGSGGKPQTSANPTEAKAISKAIQGIIKAVKDSGLQDQGASVRVQISLAKDKDTAKAANIHGFEKAGDVAFRNGDAYTLALCVLGLSAEGHFGDHMKQAALKWME